MTKWKRLIGLLALGGLLAGCAGIQTLSNYARTGDTVSMAVGPTAPGLFIRQEQATVTLIDSANVSHPVTLRDLFRVYADPTSSYSIRSVKNQGWSNPPYEQLSTPYEGQWIAVVDLVDPSTGSPPALATGSAQLTFSSPVTGTVTSTLTILPGTGALNPMATSPYVQGYRPLDALVPMPQVTVTPSTTPSVPLGGGTFTFDYVTANFTNGSANTTPTVVLTSPDHNIELSSEQQALSNGDTQITVSILNPHGFQTDNSTSSGPAEQMSLLRDLKFVIVWDKSLTNITDTNWQNSLWLVSGHYFDLNGAPVSGLTPVLTKVR
ncbi:MAG: hypothetical protein ACYCQK_03675 [Acidiferrobacteraceae bacterium]